MKRAFLLPPSARMPICTALVLAAVSLRPAFAQDPANDSYAVQRALIAEERDRSEVMANLEYLSDMIGPRLTGSERLVQANQWTAEKMRAYGLENVHLESYTIPRGWERGKVEARVIAPTVFPLNAAQYAWTPGTRGKVTGPVVVFAPKTEADFAAFHGKLKNAIVLSSPLPTNPLLAGALALPDSKPSPPIPAFAKPGSSVLETPSAAPSGMEQEEDLESQPPPDRARMQEFRRKTNAFMKAEGVAAILLDSNKPHALLNMTGSWNSTQDFPSLFVPHEQIALLQRLLHRNLPVTMELKVDCKFTRKPVTVFNTVGEIRGTTKPDEVVLLGAHLDSWDLGQGSTDNGTGSMAVLEAARILKAQHIQPTRTIRFVLFSGEEEGLNGSKAYVEAHKSELPRYSVVFVHDTGTGRVRGAWLQNRAEAKPVLAEEFALLQTLGLLTDAPNLLPGKMNGTDHASFDNAGVPAFSFNQESAEYSLTHHSQSDTFDKARPDDLKQGACVLAILAYDAAQRAEAYPRTPVRTP